MRRGAGTRPWTAEAVRATLARKRRLIRRELLEASQAMLVWNLSHGSGCKSKARAIASRNRCCTGQSGG